VKVILLRYRFRRIDLKPYSLATSGWSVCIRFLIFMRVKINGDEREIADGIDLAGLLESLQIRPGRVVVERNKEIVPRDLFSAISLVDGDVLEIVHFVGGG
jgi:sulfur carrier protein